jgi:hypothetical protein
MRAQDPAMYINRQFASMRFLALLFLPIASLVLSGCVAAHSQSTNAQWTSGFWFWPGSSSDEFSEAPPVDVLFVNVGSINKRPPWQDQKASWSVWGQLPDDLPDAREYWLVFRCDSQEVPDIEVATMLGRRISLLREQARQVHWPVAGVQLDIDSPTRALPQYAKFLHELKKNLPQGVRISITGLLDWFRPGAAIADVIKETDEFVPQFYDVAYLSAPDGRTAIAAKIDAAEWGPKLGRFGKPFRIGVSAFGRASYQRAGSPAALRVPTIFPDLAPLDIGANSAFSLETTRDQANELILNYRANRRARIDWNTFEAGDTVRFTLPTSEAIRAAVASAKSMRGSIGVLFFRWPGENDHLVMLPEEVLTAAGASSQQSQNSSIAVIDGSCAAVKCVDVYLVNAHPLSAEPAQIRIRSSVELEYFLPEKTIPVRMTGPSTLELSLPPYCGQRRMYLGRVVTAKPSEFSLEEAR